MRIQASGRSGQKPVKPQLVRVIPLSTTLALREEEDRIVLFRISEEAPLPSDQWSMRSMPSRTYLGLRGIHPGKAREVLEFLHGKRVWVGGVVYRGELDRRKEELVLVPERPKAQTKNRTRKGG
jgi:hypothetical protein